MEDETRIEFYRKIGYSEEEIKVQLERIYKTEEWTKKVLQRRPKFLKASKYASIFQVISFILLGIVFILSFIDPFVEYVRSNPWMILIWLIPQFILTTIGFILEHYRIRNETYFHIKESEELRKQLSQ